MAAILGISTAICAFGWLISKIASISLVMFMLEKGYKPPTEEEVKVYTRKTVNKLLKR